VKVNNSCTCIPFIVPLAGHRCFYGRPFNVQDFLTIYLTL
jgi:hypothetical protein